jgi:hypothetical protein
MRSFTISASERTREDGAPTVEFIMQDRDKNTAVRMDMPYGDKAGGRTRDQAYAMLKDVAGASLRQRVAEEVLPPAPECEYGCVKGYLPLNGGGVRLCANDDCRDYRSLVLDIGETVDIQVAYRPGTHHDGGFEL